MAIKKKNTLIENTKVLVVDDQAQSYFKFSLDKLGFTQVIYALHASAALKECEQNDFDIVLCSYNLSKGKDGYHLYEELQNRKLIRPSTGFIFVSSETGPDLVHAVVELQPDDFLVKPFTMKELGNRLQRIINHKQALRRIYVHLDKEQYEEALAILDADLNNPDRAPAYPLLLKVKGDCLLANGDYQQALEFYRSIINVQKFSWAKMGLVKAMIGVGLYDEAEKLLVRLALKPDTKLVAFELMAEIRFKLEGYEDALESEQIAADISPRNMTRQKKIVNLARLDHNYQAQLEATKHIAKYAKQSIHDKPETYLNIARASVDYALVANDDKARDLLMDAQATIATMMSAFSKAKIDDQINIVNARICLAKSEKEKAQRMIDEVEGVVSETDSLEDLIDKSKAYHAMGMKDESAEVMAEIERRMEADTTGSEFLKQYVAQEKVLQETISRTPKQLNNDAVNFYERGDMAKAMEAFKQAFIFMPKNTSIALNLLQTLVMEFKEEGFSEEQQKTIQNCMKAIENGELSIDQEERYNKVKEFINPVSAEEVSL